MPIAASLKCSLVVAVSEPPIEAHKLQLAGGADDAAIVAARQVTRAMPSATTASRRLSREGG
jgi:hypothetical protein